MTLIIIMIAIVLSGVVYAKVPPLTLERVNPRRMLGSASSKMRYGGIAHLSRPGREVVYEYRDLHVDDRPAYDIIQIVEAIDLKYDGDDVEGHYEHYLSSNFSWAGHLCYGSGRYSDTRECTEYPEYMDLHNKFQALADSRAEQEKVLKIAGAQSGLDNLEALRDELRERAKTNREITKSLTEPYDPLLKELQ